MGEIRIVGPGKTRGYPYPVCKKRVYIPVWEQIATDQTGPWQVVPRQVLTPYDCLLISVAFVVLCRVGCLYHTHSQFAISYEAQSIDPLKLFSLLANQDI